MAQRNKGSRRRALKKRFERIRNMEKNNLKKGHRYLIGDKPVTGSLSSLRKSDRKVTSDVNRQRREAFTGGKEKKSA